MSYSELLVSLENIISDRVAAVPKARNKKHDTSAPMEIGMAAKEDGESASQEGETLLCRLSTKELAKERPMAEGQWQERKPRARQMWQGKRPEHVGRVAGQDTLQRGVEQEVMNKCTPLMKTTVKTSKN